jgi:hypothetical protein
MSKRELGKLASVVDVDAPRAKRRKEAAPQEEKKPEADMDVDVTGEMKREQEDPAKLEQVKEQGLKLWQTLRDAVDKECVTDLRLFAACLSLLPHTMFFPPAAAHFQPTFFDSPINECTPTITPS